MAERQDAAVVLMAHGTRSQEGLFETRSLAAKVAAAFGGPCELGFIELAPPSLDEALAKAAAAAERVAAIPLMLNSAGHLKSDAAGAVARGRALEGSSLSYGRGLGAHPGILGLLAKRANAALSRLPGIGRQAVVVVGRGSTDPDANAEMFRFARLAQEPFGLPNTEAAFVSLASPGVQEALDRAAALGATEIAVAPYFLFEGVLLRRIAQQAAAWSESRRIPIEVAAHLGADPVVVEAVLERIAEAAEGRSAAICDCCVHRVALPGHEARLHAPLPMHAGGHCH